MTAAGAPLRVSAFADSVETTIQARAVDSEIAIRMRTNPWHLRLAARRGDQSTTLRLAGMLLDDLDKLKPKPCGVDLDELLRIENQYRGKAS